ncbi:MAG: 6-phosphofructokinase [Acidobacteria bacterium]|nr:6-phosphofructokinase [Acidobacteriota bacterium]
MAGKHIGVLTGGGDVPGLNAAIKSVYTAARDQGWLRPGSSDANVTGILRGWKGTVEMRRDSGSGRFSETLPLTGDTVRTVDRFGGTFLHTSRTRPDRMRLESVPEPLRSGGGGVQPVGPDHFDLTDVVIRNLTDLGIDCLVAIGGDDTLGYARTLHRRGFPVVAIPKTMDNDVRGTDYCLGFSTAVHRAVSFLNRQRTHLGSHETIGVFRIFGRDAGFTALAAAMAISDIRCLIPEHRFDLQELCRTLAADYKSHPSRYAMALCSEGAIWKGGTLEEVGAPDGFGRGEPDHFDKIVANTFGALAVELIAAGKSGRMVCLRQGVYDHADLPEAGAGARTVDVEKDYDPARFRPRFTGRWNRSPYA